MSATHLNSSEVAPVTKPHQRLSSILRIGMLLRAHVSGEFQGMCSRPGYLPLVPLREFHGSCCCAHIADRERCGFKRGVVYALLAVEALGRPRIH